MGERRLTGQGLLFMLQGQVVRKLGQLQSGSTGDLGRAWAMPGTREMLVHDRGHKPGFKS